MANGADAVSARHVHRLSTAPRSGFPRRPPCGQARCRYPATGSTKPLWDRTLCSPVVRLPQEHPHLTPANCGQRGQCARALWLDNRRRKRPAGVDRHQHAGGRAITRRPSAGGRGTCRPPARSARATIDHRPRPGRGRMRADVLARGLVAGAAGVAAMTLAEKLEQAITGRPNSYVPAHTLERLLRLPARPDAERLWLNWAMHWGQGIVLGAVRTAMAECGIRGPMGSLIHMNLRLLNDQALENATGVGA